MRRKLTYSSIYTCMWLMVVATAIFMNLAFVEGVKHRIDTTEFHFTTKGKSTKSPFYKSSLHLVLPPLKPAVTSSVKVSVSRPDDKLLNGVQVYPNPVVNDQINLKYNLSRNANVTIKIMDVLGNEITTLFSQRVEMGDHNLNYAVNNKLSRGFYFVRVVAGTESVIKRISLL